MYVTLLLASADVLTLDGPAFSELRISSRYQDPWRIKQDNSHLSLHPPPYSHTAVCVAYDLAGAVADYTLVGNLVLLPYAISELKMLKVTGTQHLSMHAIAM